jgi:hypothetical protein
MLRNPAKNFIIRLRVQLFLAFTGTLETNRDKARQSKTYLTVENRGEPLSSESRLQPFDRLGSYYSLAACLASNEEPRPGNLPAESCKKPPRDLADGGFLLLNGQSLASLEECPLLAKSFGTLIVPARAESRGVHALGGRNFCFAWLFFVESLCVAGTYL